jgi:tRNA (uracil-5-)-methyltransferase
VNCKHFGECGSCDLYNLSYQDALNSKLKSLKALLDDFYKLDIEVFKSPQDAHRARAEFKIWHIDNKINYAMSNLQKDGITILNECPKVIKPIKNIYQKLLDELNSIDILKDKLFAIEFLASLDNEVLVTLIYHKKLDNSWIKEAKKLENKFNIFVIGRARKQKIVLTQEYITQSFIIKDKKYIYRYFEGSFTQPNPYINKNMIEWVIDNIKDNRGDFLEAYCGLGNFTLPISRYFDKVLATEVSKTSIKSAKINCKINDINNIVFARLNAKETAEALRKERVFNRLKDINLDDYNFSTILVDPPRAGLDSDTLELAKSFEHIVYISCNPKTLARDLKELCKTHRVLNLALFDQFPYTHHIESGVYLKRI